MTNVINTANLHEGKIHICKNNLSYYITFNKYFLLPPKIEKIHP